VEVVSLGFIKPLDHETVLQSVSKTGRVLIVQDEPPYGGYALYVRSLLDSLPAGRLKVAPRIINGAEHFAVLR
jgi:2-oxoisovalerate dehydrogenase E1 component beta subunit